MRRSGEDPAMLQALEATKLDEIQQLAHSVRSGQVVGTAIRPSWLTSRVLQHVYRALLVNKAQDLDATK